MFSALAAGAGAGIGALVATLLPLKGKARGYAFGIAAVIGVSVGPLLADRFAPDRSLELEFAEALDDAPLVGPLVRNDPQRRELYASRLASAARQGGQGAATTEMTKIAGEVVAEVFRPSLPKASPEALHAVLGVQTDYLALLSERDPEGCYAVVTRAARQQPAYPKELQERMTRAMTQVVESARSAPVTMTAGDREAADSTLAGITEMLVNGTGSEALYAGEFTGEKASTPEERRGACLFTLRLYQELQELPLEQQHPAFRRLLNG